MVSAIQVLFLQKNSDALVAPLTSNLHSAVRVSLLQLPEEFTREELYETIARLSYSGDIRMRIGIGENPNKINNIVKKNMQQFDLLYDPILRVRCHARDRDAANLHCELPQFSGNKYTT